MVRLGNPCIAALDSFGRGWHLETGTDLVAGTFKACVSFDQLFQITQ